MAVLCWCVPQESLTEIQKLFLFWVPIISLQDWKAKVERSHFLKIQSGKITVWFLRSCIHGPYWAKLLTCLHNSLKILTKVFGSVIFEVIEAVQRRTMGQKFGNMNLFFFSYFKCQFAHNQSLL